MRSATILVASLLAFIPNVVGHGYLKSVAIDGKTYQGNVPNNPSVDSPIRLIDDVDPVKGASNPNLSCGQNAQNAALVASANPGSEVAFAWASGNGGNWPHNTGPMLTYMASCGDTTCDKFDASNAQWFKVDEVGKKSDGSAWVQQDIMNGKTYSFTLPDNIQPGDYLIRHEIIALQLAVSEGGAEFYPSCTQVRIGGNGNGAPNATVSFPGAYSDTDPGILTPDVYNPGFTYTFPGPAIASFVAGSSGSGNGNNASTNSTASASSAVPSSTTPSSAAPSSSSTSGSGGCYDMNGNYARDEYRPRRLSRVMRNMN
ncbi:hypothetical protein L226DRAFT_473662 [Lentinus tigrinus ALCF2SS1-7]|uniref:lytic cellulose monooxygenase (C4-dehydrogenating) n=1 Tax=Lentinus tigrinus ALCF2SS1-6 TaxID=1328759 RepID=A0A5C2RSF1_9APHY|nr:hypothetical protein L227DRAFT_513812 [Lentinus tigrinus ALCF2SS1-6]RPD68285.1 hypothetical protein L226DRAFT_473662 [Lentinus tigrinus ALCF2SS1-7]